MGEVLRAILERNCTYSQEAFYSARITTQLINSGTRLFSRRQASINCKSDTWFMMVGATQDASFMIAGGPYLWEPKTFPSTFSIQRANTGETFSLTPSVQSNLNYNCNNFVSLDEYILFEPAELILIQEDVLVSGPGAVGLQADTFVTLQGIEYQMPSSGS